MIDRRPTAPPDDRTTDERTNERTNDEGTNDERANDERTNDERANDERTNERPTDSTNDASNEQPIAPSTDLLSTEISQRAQITSLRASEVVPGGRYLDDEY